MKSKNEIKWNYIYFLIFKFCTMSNLIPNFIPKVFTIKFLSNFKVTELRHEHEHEHEPGD